MGHVDTAQRHAAPALAARIDELLVAAMPHVSPDRSMALIRQWVPRDGASTSARAESMVADAMMLSVELVMFEPSLNGQLPIDRAAPQGGKPDAITREALAALRAARCRLLRVETAPRPGMPVSLRGLVPVKAAMVEEELEKLGLALRSRSVGGRKRVLGEAFAEGRAAGERFEVAPGLTRAA